MKLSTNLPGNLRAFFGFLRVLIIVGAAIWAAVLTFDVCFRKAVYGPDSKSVFSLGEIIFQPEPGALALTVEGTDLRALELVGLRGSVRINMLSPESGLVRRAYGILIPSITLFAAGWWFLVNCLRTLSGNIERGEIFTDQNVRLVRRVGLILVWYSFAGFVVTLGGTFIMKGYFEHHVILSGLMPLVSALGGAGPLQFNFPSDYFPGLWGFVTGGLVLMIGEAFRQGLNLKAENDLTV
jgi:hypothetical protein